MATTTKKVRLHIVGTDGRESTLTINAEPINDTFVDPDTSEALWPTLGASIAGGWESDYGASAQSIRLSTITTTTDTLSSQWINE